MGENWCIGDDGSDEGFPNGPILGGSRYAGGGGGKTLRMGLSLYSDEGNDTMELELTRLIFVSSSGTSS